MENIKKKSLMVSLLISLFYVGLGTISLLALYPSSPIFGEWSLYTTLLTFPVSFIGFGIAYAEPNNIPLLLFVQLVVFLLFWLIIYRMSYSYFTKSK